MVVYSDRGSMLREINLYVQPNMSAIPRESINEIIEDYRELFTPPTIREELRDAKAIYNDHRYGIIYVIYVNKYLLTEIKCISDKTW